ncbi:MAG: DUF4352 domain-containing protein [Coriobacteriia bacterium]|nr:DUF4352 domain-containing protein [Coriobacteriia bacterium]
MKKLIYVLVFGLLAAVAIACTPADEPTLAESNEPAMTEEAPAAEEEESTGPEIFSVGDTVEAGNFRVTVNSVRTDTGEDFFGPDEGNEFFYVDMSIENISDDEQTISSILMFTIFDEDGRQLDQALFADTQGSLDGTIAPTRTLTGEYAVEAPEGATGLELQFEGALFGGRVILFELN